MKKCYFCDKELLSAPDQCPCIVNETLAEKLSRIVNEEFVEDLTSDTEKGIWYSFHGLYKDSKFYQGGNDTVKAANMLLALLMAPILQNIYNMCDDKPVDVTFYNGAVHAAKFIRQKILE